MCCNLSVKPLVPEIAASILAIGLFVPTAVGEQFQRLIPEEQNVVLAQIDKANNTLTLKIYPSISTDEHHNHKRIAAGVYFEIAAKYAEKVGGEIIQHSNVGQCRTDGGTVTNHLLAHYPELPLSFSRVCPGFQKILLGAVASD